MSAEHAAAKVEAEARDRFPGAVVIRDGNGVKIRRTARRGDEDDSPCEKRRRRARVAQQATLALAVTAQNEVPLSMRNTISTAVTPRLEEIRIYDDSSKSPINLCDLEIANLSRDSGIPISVVHQKERFGPGPTRHRACVELSEHHDLVVLTDSHMRFPRGWAIEMIKAHAKHPDSVFMASSIGFDHGATGFRGTRVNLRVEKGGIVANWTAPHVDPSDDALYPRTPCMMGAFYMLPRSVLEKIGGYAPCFRGYGYEEEYIALRCAVLGIPIRCAVNVYMCHDYARGKEMDRTPKQGPHEEYLEGPFNRMVAAMVVWDDFEPELGLLRASVPHSQDLAAVERCIEDAHADIMKVRSLVQSSRVLSDQQVYELMCIAPPREREVPSG